MAQFPSLPLWTDAYLADTGHLTDAEHGVYLQLLMMMWRTPECRVPNDDKWLARHFRRTVEEVAQTVRPVIAEFCKNDGNWIAQGRLKDEWNYCRRQSKSQSGRAKSRWRKEKSICPGDAARHDVGNAPYPSPSLEDSPNGESPPIAPQNGKDIEAAFEEWWFQVLRKTGKKKAKGLYIGVIKRGEATTDVLMAGMLRYNASDTVSKGYIVYPSTWITQGRWDDQPDPPPPAPTSPTLEAIRSFRDDA
ncbi:hypothetical protein LCGC14_0354710 [marine sediment metagenome]|uniref:DUF1376 domain-containing protein n=1 Tax=marine sediment metagenome TaxID=412755 RepID=A0A0F9VWS3_9ZZZZ